MIHTVKRFTESNALHDNTVLVQRVRATQPDASVRDTR